MVYDSLYIFLLFLILIGIFLFDLESAKKGRLKYFFIVYVILALVAEFRYGVSPDTMNYMTAYESIPPLQDITFSDFTNYRFDIFYTLTNSIVKTIFDNYLGMQLVHGIIVYISLYKLIKFLHIDKFYVLLFFYLQFYFIFGMGTMRQSMAAGFLFYAIPYLCRGNLKMYYLLCTIAFLFHASAVITFIFPLLKAIRGANYKHLLFILALMPFFAPLSLHLLDAVAKAVGGSLANYSTRYGDNITVRYEFLIYAKNITIFYFLFIRFKSREYTLIRILGFLYLCMDMTSENLSIFFRFKDYLFPFYLYLLCRFVQDSKIQRSALFIAILFIAYFYQPIRVHISMFSNEAKQTLVPYASYFSDKNHSHYDRMKKSFVRDYMY